MKNFVVKWGRALIDIGAWIIVITIVAGCGATGAIVLIPVGLFLFITVYYVLYVFIDIRDSLQDIRDSLKEREN